MSSVRSFVLLLLVTLSMTVLAAPVAHSGDISGTGLESGSASGSPYVSSISQPEDASTNADTDKTTNFKDDEDALIETIAPAGNGNLNGNKIIASVNTLNDVLSDNLNNSSILSHILSDNDDNSINIGLKNRRNRVFKA